MVVAPGAVPEAEDMVAGKELFLEEEGPVVNRGELALHDCNVHSGVKDHSSSTSGDASCKAKVGKPDEAVALEASGSVEVCVCLLYTSPSPRDQRGSRMPSSA